LSKDIFYLTLFFFCRQPIMICKPNQYSQYIVKLYMNKYFFWKFNFKKNLTKKKGTFNILKLSYILTKAFCHLPKKWIKNLVEMHYISYLYTRELGLLSLLMQLRCQYLYCGKCSRDCQNCDTVAETSKSLLL
jgi:hypothetical protein